MKKEVLGVLIDMFCLSPVSSDVRWLDDAEYGGLCGLGWGGKSGFSSRRGA